MPFAIRPIVFTVALFAAVSAHAAFDVNIDDFDVGAISLSSSPPSGVQQNESGLLTSSVIGGYRSTQINTCCFSTSIANPAGQAQITYPTGLTDNFIFFIYNNGGNPGSLDLDLSQMVAFHVDFTRVAASQSVQIYVFDANQNSRIATKSITAGVPTTLSFLPTDFTVGPPGIIQRIWLHISGDTFNLPVDDRTTLIDSFVLETLPEPDPRLLGFTAVGTLALFAHLRRRRLCSDCPAAK